MATWKLSDPSSRVILAKMMDRDSTCSAPTTPMEAFSTTLPSPPFPQLSNDDDHDACDQHSSYSHFCKSEDNVGEGSIFLADVRNPSLLHCAIPQLTEGTPASAGPVVDTVYAEPESKEGGPCISSPEGRALPDRCSQPSENNLPSCPCDGWDPPLASPEAPPSGKANVDCAASRIVGPLSWQHAFGFSDELRRLQSQFLTLECEHVESKQRQEEMAALLVKSTIYMEELKASLQKEKRQREDAERIVREFKLQKDGDRDIQGQLGSAEGELVCCSSSHDVTSSLGNFPEILINKRQRKKFTKDVPNTSLTFPSSASMGHPRREAIEAMKGRITELEKENAHLKHDREALLKRLRSAFSAREAAELDQRHSQEHIGELKSQLAQAISDNARLVDSTDRALGEKAAKVAEMEQQLEVALRTRRTAEELRVLSELSLSFILGWLNRDSSPQWDGVWGQEEAEQTDAYGSSGELADAGEGIPAQVYDTNAVLNISKSDILSNLECPTVLTNIRAHLPSKLGGLHHMEINSKEAADVKALPERRECQEVALSNATLLSLPQYHESVNRALAAARLGARRRRSANRIAIQDFFDSCLSLVAKTQFELSSALEAFSARLFIAQQRLQKAVVCCSELGVRDADIETQLRSELRHMQENLSNTCSHLRLLQVEKEGVEKQLIQVQSECLLADKLNELDSSVVELQRNVGRALRQTVRDLRDVVAVDADSLQGSFLTQIQALALRAEAHLELIDRFLTCQRSDSSSDGVLRKEGVNDDFARSSCALKIKQSVSLVSPIPTSCTGSDSPCVYEGMGKIGDATSLGGNNTVSSFKRRGDPAIMPSSGESGILHETVSPISPRTMHMMTPRQMNIYHHMKRLIHASPSPFSTAAGPSSVAQRSFCPSTETPFPASATHRSHDNGSRGDATPTRLAVAALPVREELVQGARALTRQLTNVCKILENSFEQNADHARSIQDRIALYEKNIKNAIETAVTAMSELPQRGTATKTKSADAATAFCAPSSLLPCTSLSPFPHTSSSLQPVLQEFCCNCQNLSAADKQTSAHNKGPLSD